MAHLPLAVPSRCWCRECPQEEARGLDQQGEPRLPAEPCQSQSRTCCEERGVQHPDLPAVLLLEGVSHPTAPAYPRTGWGRAQPPAGLTSPPSRTRRGLPPGAPCRRPCSCLGPSPCGSHDAAWRGTGTSSGSVCEPPGPCRQSAELPPEDVRSPSSRQPRLIWLGIHHRSCPSSA